MRIVAVTILALNLPVLSVNNEFCPLMLADLSARIDSIHFLFKVTAGTVRSSFLNIPTALWIGDYVM